MKIADKKNSEYLKASRLDTPLGPMVAVADEEALYLLEFSDGPGLKSEIERLRQKTTATIIAGYTPPLHSIKSELSLYFDGMLTEFKTPLFLSGSGFQKNVWEELRKIPLGKQDFTQP